MYKDIMISLLGALLLKSIFNTTEIGEQIAIVMGLAAMLFIFCLFCEIWAEKWQKYHQRVQNLEKRLEQLRGGWKHENRESAGDHEEAGADTNAAVDDAG